MEIYAKVYYSNYNPDTGISIVKINTPYGMIKGTAKLHPDDKEVSSKYAGCKYAEMRAWIKYFKMVRRFKNDTLKELEHIKNSCKDHNAKWILDKRMKEIAEEIKTLSARIQYTEEDLKKSIETRDKTLSRILKQSKQTLNK